MTNGSKTLCLLFVSRVNIRLQWKVQKVTPTFPIQVSTVVLYHSQGTIGYLSLGVNFINVGNCWISIRFE